MISIVIPTYQEAENLPILIPRIAEAMRSLADDYEVIVVDDDSPDDTPAVMARLAKEGHPTRLIIRKNERGLATAVLRGFDEARGDILLCMDADLSHPPETIPSLIDAIRDPAVDFVIGSRYVEGGCTGRDWGLLRWLNSKIATLLAWPLTRVADPMAGYFAIRRDTLNNAAPLCPVGYKIALELLVKCGCRNVREVPIAFANRQHGNSKLTLGEQFRYLRHIKRLMDFKFANRSRLVQFCMVGATGMVIDLTTFNLLLAGLGAYGPGHELSRGVARGIAILVAMGWNFLWNRHMTFSYARHRPALGQFLRFVITCSIGAGVNWGAFMILGNTLEWFQRHPNPAALIGIAVGTLSNFCLSRWWVFHSPTNHPLSTGEKLSRESSPPMDDV